MAHDQMIIHHASGLHERVKWWWGRLKRKPSAFQCLGDRLRGRRLRRHGLEGAVTVDLWFASTSPHRNEAKLVRFCTEASARAFSMVASILRRLRTMPGSAMRRAKSFAPVAGNTLGIELVRRLCENFSRFLSMVSHESPDWKPSSTSFSNSSYQSFSARPIPHRGRPHTAGRRCRARGSAFNSAPFMTMQDFAR